MTAHPVTPCGCGRSWPTIEAKRAELVPAGTMDFGDEVLEIGNCRCGSTLCVERTWRGEGPDPEVAP